MPIFSVASPAGAGKTHSLINHAFAEAIFGEKTLIVQPTIKLLDQTAAAFATMNADRVAAGEFPVPVRVMHTGTVLIGVADEIVNHFRKSRHGGEILLISHAAFLVVPYFEHATSWHLVIDEILPVRWSQERILPRNHGLITSAITTVPHNATHDKVIITNRKRLEDIVDGADEADNLVADVGYRLLSSHWEITVPRDDHAALLAGTGHKVLFFGVLQPSIVKMFGMTTIMGANFADSALAHHWGKTEEFVPHPVITPRFAVHPNGERLTIVHAGYPTWSKRQRNKLLTVNGVTKPVIEHLIAQFVAEVGQQPYVYMINKSVDPALFAEQDAIVGGKGMQLPNQPHGTNSFKHIHIAILLSALNPTPDYMRFAKSEGRSSDDVWIDIHCEGIYQAGCRTSMREIDDESPVVWFVPDARTANHLASKIPGCTVVQLPGEKLVPKKATPGRKPVHDSSATKHAASKARIRDRIMAELDVLNGTNVVLQPGASTLRNAAELSLGTAGNRLSLDGLYGSFFNGVDDKTPSHAQLESADEFIEFLKLCSADTIKSKESSALVTPGLYDVVRDPEHGHTLSNIAAARGIWIDCDNGAQLTPEIFANLFPKLRIVAMNTYSSTLDQPRYRLYIPTNALMSIDAYRKITARIVEKLGKAGYKRDGDKRHGIDIGKMTPAALFYLPAQAADPIASFFQDFAGPGRDALDVYHWVDRAITAEEAGMLSEPSSKPVARTGGQSNRMAALREALCAERSKRRSGPGIEKWRAEAMIKGRGHDAFFALATSLARAGYDATDMHTILAEEAMHARSPNERMREISRNVANAIRLASSQFADAAD
jgi:hypothetical protein